MKRKITAQCVNSLQPRQKIYKVWDTQIPGFHLRVMPSGTKTFAIFYRIDNRAKDYTIGKLGKFTASTARDEATRLMAGLSIGIDPQAEKKKQSDLKAWSKNQKLGAFIENSYSSWAVAEQKRGDETLKLLKSNFDQFYSKNMSEISIDDVRTWRQSKLKQGLAKTTLNRRVTALKSVLSRAVEWGILEENPLKALKPLKVDEKGKVRYLEPDEENRLLNALDEREKEIRDKRRSGNQWRLARGHIPKDDLDEVRFADYLKPLVLVGLHTGLRRGEIFSLEWSDVVLNEKNPHLTVVGATSKSVHTRHVPLNSFCRRVLADWQAQRLEGTSLVFPNPKTGARFDNIKSSWSALVKSADVENFRFHDLRHNFASQLVMKNVSLYVVKELLGHSSIEMTQRYAHLAPDSKLAAVETLL